MNTKDPLLIQSEPVTLLLPVLENNLKKLNIKVTRDVLVKRFYNGAERTAVISGSQDHPAHLYDEALIRNLMKEIWEQGGLPFSFQVPALCDGIAQGHYGMQFSLFSRDLTTQIVVSQVLAHHYDSAIFISGCDKNPIGFTGAAVVIDQIYRKYYKKNFYSIFLNTPVMKDIPLPLSVKKLLPDDNKLKPLLGETLKCNVYAKYYKVLAEMVKEKKLAETKKRALLNRISQYTCITGGTCAFMGTGSTSKFILYALGLVPDEYFLPFPGTFSMPVHAKKAVKILNRITGKIGFSPVNLITKNFQNALKVLGSVNGSLNLFLHLKYLAGLLGDPSLFKSSSVHGVPLLYNGNMSLFDMSKKRIHFSIMRSLFDRNILKDNPSITGSWVQRLKKYSGSSVTSDGRSNFIQFAGNIFKSVLIKLNMKEYQKLEKLN
ncbi:MAG: dihydroxy-acid dehydratase, partial [Spirochaetes bacterium]|nr:dihydroxy-acid dehydratase [Spirochaetota bacterium]